MTLADIREQIKTILSGVPGIGVRHDYERWANDWNVLLGLYKDANGRINGCSITRTATEEHWLTNIDYERVYEMVIRGYYGLSDADASEIVVQDMVEAICDKFRGNDTLDGTCETINPAFGAMAGKSGLQVVVVENRMFGTVLCHYYELRLGAQIHGQR